MSLFHTNTLLGASGSGGDPIYVDDVFSTFIYDGTGSTLAINNGIDLSGEGGMTWVKCRSDAADNRLIDTERGAHNILTPNNTTANFNNSTIFSSFNSNGFSLATDVASNGSGRTFCSWSFRKARGFFDVVTWTGNGVDERLISHNLGSTPGMIMVKCTSHDENWIVWHRSIATTSYLQLNTNDAVLSGIKPWGTNTQTINSTHFSVNNYGSVNSSGRTYVAYIFAHDNQSFGDNSDEAIIKCDTVTISGSGTFDVNNLGFEPQYVLFKQISGAMSSPDWYIHDNMRGLVQRNFIPLLANETNAETSNSYYYNEGILTVNPQGFKSILSNHNAGDYIYMAIRRPHKPPTAGTDVFKAVTYAGSSSAQTITGAGFAPDLMWSKDRSASNNGWFHDRLRGVYSLDPSGAGAEQDRISYVAQPPFTMDGVKFIQGGFDLNRNGSNHVAQFFKRAPGFFDIVAYTGNSSARNITHSLGVTPELIIMKSRSLGESFIVNSTHFTTQTSQYFNLNLNGALVSVSNFFAAPSSTTFGFGSGAPSEGQVNRSGETYIAYLFATLDGISKVGTYTGAGSGNSVDVDCGFTAGARFVVIKDTEATGDWYVYDSTRGIVSGNDPILFFNSTAAEQSAADDIDPLNAGFTVVSNNSGLNTSGRTYLFLAIA